MRAPWWFDAWAGISHNHGMYLPKYFEVDDVAVLQAHIAAHPLATWATSVDGEIVVNHVPFRLDVERRVLVGHVARANPVWRQPAKSVFVFQGPSAYVSPSFYPSKAIHHRHVPTYNYAVVHAHGTPRVVDDPAALLAILTLQTTTHEATQPMPWSIDDAPADFVAQLLQAIVGIEVPVDKLVGKWKVSQNRDDVDSAGVASALRARDPHDLMADLVEQHRPR